jgi:hypothetical protein
MRAGTDHDDPLKIDAWPLVSTITQKDDVGHDTDSGSPFGSTSCTAPQAAEPVLLPPNATSCPEAVS